MSVNFIGFDSAWTDNPKMPGAICSLSYDGKRFCKFNGPSLVRFSQALEFIRKIHVSGQLTLIAIDQPTIVPNHTGMRPAERVAASAISWLGGGVQPANRSKVGMFDDGAPIWKFLRDLAASEDPERARLADSGIYVIEVFPALALPAFHDDFCGRLRGYPGRRKTFRQGDWIKVNEALATEARSFSCRPFDEWCASSKAISAPQKSDQDKLDAVVCLLIAIRWRQLSRNRSVMIGDTTEGYIVAPTTSQIRERLKAKAALSAVALDGVIHTRRGG
jgi:predicted RNase H-like nuclease